MNHCVQKEIILSFNNHVRSRSPLHQSNKEGSVNVTEVPRRGRTDSEGVGGTDMNMRRLTSHKLHAR